MAKISWKPGTMMSPLPPVMVTCGTMENPNVLTIAWTGIVNSEPPMTYISVRPTRHSHKMIQESGEFVINLTTLELVRAADYCGIKSGKNTNKFADMGLELEPCSQVNAPMLAKTPIALECKVKSVSSLGTHDMFLAEIVNVNVDDQYLEEDGLLAIEKAGLIAFVHGRYFTLGRDLGGFGFSVDKSKENKTAPRKSKKVEALEERVAKLEAEKREALTRREEHRSDKAPRHFDNDKPRSDRAPRRFDDDKPRGDRAPRRFDDDKPRGNRGPRRFDDDKPRGDRAPRRFDGDKPRSDRAPRRFDGDKPRSDRAPRRFGDDKPRGDRAPRRFDGDKPRGDRAPRRIDEMPKQNVRTEN